MSVQSLDRNSVAQQTTTSKLALIVFPPIANVSPAGVQALRDMVDSLLGRGIRLTAIVEEQDEFSTFLSQRGVYYHLSAIHRDEWKTDARLPAQGFTGYTEAMRKSLALAKFDAVIIASSYPIGIATRCAAALANIPVRCTFAAERLQPDVAAAANEAFSRRLDSVDAILSGDEIAELICSNSPVGRVVANAQSLTRSVAWKVGGYDRLIYAYFKRAADVVAGLLLLPLSVILSTLLCIVQSKQLRKVNAHGKDGCTFPLRVFAKDEAASQLPVYWWLPAVFALLNGTISLVGPRLLFARGDSAAKPTYWVAPGLIAWSNLRKDASTTEDQLASMDNLYMATYSPIVDLKIVASFAISVLKGRLR